MWFVCLPEFVLTVLVLGVDTRARAVCDFCMLKLQQFKPFRMFDDRLIVSLLMAFAFAQQVFAEPTPDRVQLVNGVLKGENWPDIWFGSVVDGADWMPVSAILGESSALDVADKLEMIPVMMGCEYGLGFNRFFSAAALAIDQCNYSSQVDQQQTSDDLTGSYRQSRLTRECWTATDAGLRGGFSAMDRVESALILLVGKNIDLDAFHKTLVEVRRILGSEVKAESPFMSGSMTGAADVLAEYLISHCRPVYAPFDPMPVIDQCSNRNRNADCLYANRLYVDRMEEHSRYISDHLTKIGFRYNAQEDTTTFQQ